MTRRPARSAVAARGIVAAGVATMASTVGHAVGQQTLPSMWVVALAFALAAPVCVALAGRRLSVPRLATAVALSQLAFHLLLRLDFTGPSHVVTGSHGAMAMAMAMTDAAGSAAHGQHPSMWVGHALAAAATVVVLVSGERAVLVLVGMARRPFRALAGLAAPPAVAPRRIAGTVCIRPSLRLVGVVRRRGPPALV